MFLMAVLAVVIFVMIFLMNRHFNFWKDRGIPQTNLSFCQNLISILFLKFPSLSEYNRLKAHGIFGFYISFKPAILLTDPTIVSDMFIRDSHKMFNRQNANDLTNDPLSYNLVSMHDDVWHRYRSSLSPAFMVSKIKNILPAIQRANERLETFIGENKVIEVNDMMFRAVTDIISAWIFSVNVDSISNPNEINEFYKTSTKFFSTSWFASFKNLLMFFVPSIYKLLRMKALDGESESFLQGFINETVTKRKNISENSYNDYIQFLLKRKECKEKIDTVELTAQALMVFLAGLESTVATLTFALFELAKNKEIQRKCQKEIDNVLKESCDDVKPMKYLQCCIDETLRKYPALVATNRVCTEDYEIPSKGGWTIPKGTMVYLSLFRIHRDPEIFENPMEFRPERFFNSPKGCDHPGVPYMPFGLGHRFCIGRNLAQIIVKTILSRILRNFDLNLADENVKEIHFEKKQIILTPIDAINVEFRKRKSS